MLDRKTIWVLSAAAGLWITAATAQGGSKIIHDAEQDILLLSVTTASFTGI